METLSVEHALFRTFDVQIRQQLDPIWHRVSFKTKQLVNDLRSLRKLLEYLVKYDCVTFLTFLETVVLGEGGTASISASISPWLFMDAADIVFKVGDCAGGPHACETSIILFTHHIRYSTLHSPSPIPFPLTAGKTSKERVYQVTESGGRVPMLEENPKWRLVGKVLKEIDDDIEKSGTEDATVLIMVSDNRTLAFLRDYLASGDHLQVGWCAMSEPGQGGGGFVGNMRNPTSS